MKLIIDLDDDIAKGIRGENDCKVEPSEIVRSFQATIAEAIANGTPYNKADKWISVKDNLPDKNDFVLVYDGSDMFVAWYENEGMSEGWHSFDETYDRYTPIIAWRPLPKAPESEDKKC